MRYAMLPISLAVAVAASAALAQDAATLVCADYAKLDNAGKMAVQAELESMNSEMASGDTMSSADIEAGLNEDCTANPDKLVADAWKNIKGM
jgi:hypothetical protein